MALSIKDPEADRLARELWGGQELRGRERPPGGGLKLCSKASRKVSAGSHSGRWSRKAFER